jgi:RNA polymerase sigma-70 factor (ECF subfamily)
MAEAGRGAVADRGALAAALYAEHGAALYRYALMILADTADAEDAIQQVFAALVSDPTRTPEHSREYLRTAVRNTAYSLLRHRRVVREAEHLLLEPAAADCSPAERLALEAALRRLAPEQREIVHLHVYEGLTFKEAAAATGESINTVAARYRYALEKLRKVLG